MDDSFMHRRAGFANILLRIIASVFREEIGLQLSFLTVPLSGVNIKVVVAFTTRLMGETPFIGKGLDMIRNYSDIF